MSPCYFQISPRSWWEVGTEYIFWWLMADIWPNNTILNSWSFHRASLLDKLKQKSSVDAKWSIPKYLFDDFSSSARVSLGSLARTLKIGSLCARQPRLEDIFYQIHHNWDIPKIQNGDLETCQRFKVWNWIHPVSHLVPKYIIISTWCFAGPSLKPPR